MKQLAFGAMWMCCVAAGSSGQSPLAFEVASIKDAPPQPMGRVSVRMSQDVGRITYSNVSLLDIVTKAYNLMPRQVVGPEWLRNQRFDITAKLPQGALKEQVPQMLQALLAERFGLQTHNESKVMSLYALVVGKSGPKAAATESQSGIKMSVGPKGTKMTGKTTMKGLAESLSGMLDRPVVDMTELKGSFDIELAWSPEDLAKTSDGADEASVFTALQERLGLKLDPRKGAVELLVIDHVEKVPTQN